MECYQNMSLKYKLYIANLNIYTLNAFNESTSFLHISELELWILEFYCRKMRTENHSQKWMAKNGYTTWTYQIVHGISFNAQWL